MRASGEPYTILNLYYHKSAEYQISMLQFWSKLSIVSKIQLRTHLPQLACNSGQSMPRLSCFVSSIQSSITVIKIVSWQGAFCSTAEYHILFPFLFFAFKQCIWWHDKEGMRTRRTSRIFFCPLRGRLSKRPWLGKKKYKSACAMLNDGVT